MTQKLMTTTSKIMRTPASSTFRPFSISLLPLSSRRANLLDSRATRIVRPFPYFETVSNTIATKLLVLTEVLLSSPAGPFVASTLSLYFFLLFIMFYPVKAIDDFLEVRTQHKHEEDLLMHGVTFTVCLCICTDCLRPF